MEIGRKSLPHDVPFWIDPSQSAWFITICCQHRHRDQLTPVSGPVLDTVRFRHEAGKWFAHLFLLMPDHCHALLSFPADAKIAGTIRQWKRRTATQFGITWQTDFFDHRLRNTESFSQKFHYIRDNPVRAGLVSHPDDWPHQWIPPTHSG